MFEGVLRFWLDRGVDGFRVDVAHGLYKEATLRDQVRPKATEAKPDKRGKTTAEGRPVDGRAGAQRRADVGAARGARRLPALAPRPREHAAASRRRPDRRRRGLDPDRGVDGGVRPTRRAAPGLQLRLARHRLVGPRLRRRSSTARSPRSHCARLPTDVGAQQPRRRPPPDAVRRRAGRARPRPRGDAGDARAAGFGVPLPGRGARTSSRSTCRPRRARTPPGSAPASRGGTAAGCRCPWAGDAPPYAFGPGERASPGSRSRPTGRASRSRRRRPTTLDAGVLPSRAGCPPRRGCAAPTRPAWPRRRATSSSYDAAT